MIPMESTIYPLFFSFLPFIPNLSILTFHSDFLLLSAFTAEPLQFISNTTYSFQLLPSTFAMAEIDKMNRIHGVEAIIGYQFTEHSRIWEAVQAAGSPVQIIDNRRIDGGNKRLAVLGDCVMDLALAEAWLEGTGPRGDIYTSCGDFEIRADPGQGNFDAIRQSVANNANLERIGNATGLVAFVNLNPGSLGVVSKAVITATVEAILGAVYLDSNMDTVKRVMNTLGLVSPWGGP